MYEPDFTQDVVILFMLGNLENTYFFIKKIIKKDIQYLALGELACEGGKDPALKSTNFSIWAICP